MKILPQSNERSIMRFFINQIQKGNKGTIIKGEFKLVHVHDREKLDGWYRIEHNPTSYQPYTSKSISLLYRELDIDELLSNFDLRK